jgi:steroid delta-isomerase-like uncharacterized protein
MEAQRVVREWIERVWNQGDLSAIDAFHAQRFANEGVASTPDEAKTWHREMRATFPDLNYTIDELFEADGHRVIVRWTASGTHAGVLWEKVPPTGRRVSWRGIHVLRLQDGQITDVWAVSNMASIAQQLGLELRLPSRWSDERTPE